MAFILYTVDSEGRKEIDEEILETVEDLLDRINYYNSDFMLDDQQRLNFGFVDIGDLNKLPVLSLHQDFITRENIKNYIK